MLKSKEILIKKLSEISSYPINFTAYFEYFNFSNICYTMYRSTNKVRYYTSHNIVGNYNKVKDKYFIQIDIPMSYL